MALLIGAVLALAVGLLAHGVRLDRDRAFYVTVAMVIATYYLLFAAMAGSTPALLHDGAVALAFIAAALVGFRVSLWIVVATLAAHGAFDLVHARLIANPGTPAWWPPFCMAYDVAAAACLAWLLGSGRVRATG